MIFVPRSYQLSTPVASILNRVACDKCYVFLFHVSLHLHVVRTRFVTKLVSIQVRRTLSTKKLLLVVVPRKSSVMGTASTEHVQLSITQGPHPDVLNP